MDLILVGFLSFLKKAKFSHHDPAFLALRTQSCIMCRSLNLCGGHLMLQLSRTISRRNPLTVHPINTFTNKFSPANWCLQVAQLFRSCTSSLSPGLSHMKVIQWVQLLLITPERDGSVSLKESTDNISTSAGN